MSKSFIKKIAFVLVFTFFFQINSGLVLALSDETSPEIQSKITIFEIHDKITEILKYNYISENPKNRDLIKKILDLSINDISFKINFLDETITLFNTENENIEYTFKNKEIINDFNKKFEIDTGKTVALHPYTVQILLGIITYIICEAGKEVLVTVKNYVLQNIETGEPIKYWTETSYDVVPSYNGHDTNPSTGSNVYREK